MSVDDIIVNVKRKFTNHELISDLEKRVNLVYWIKAMMRKDSSVYDICLSKKLMIATINHTDSVTVLLLLSELKLENELCQCCNLNCDRTINNNILNKALSETCA